MVEYPKMLMPAIRVTIALSKIECPRCVICRILIRQPGILLIGIGYLYDLSFYIDLRWICHFQHILNQIARYHRIDRSIGFVLIIFVYAV